MHLTFHIEFTLVSESAKENIFHDYINIYLTWHQSSSFSKFSDYYLKIFGVFFVFNLEALLQFLVLYHDWQSLKKSFIFLATLPRFFLVEIFKRMIPCSISTFLIPSRCRFEMRKSTAEIEFQSSSFTQKYSWKIYESISTPPIYRLNSRTCILKLTFNLKNY